MVVLFSETAIPSPALSKHHPDQSAAIDIKARDFPGGTAVKNPPANAGDTGSRPGPGRSHMPRSS